MLTLRPLPTELNLGLTRRRWLQVSFGSGLLSAAGLTNRALANAPPDLGRAKSCIIIYLFGGPSHLDIWDLKPDAPTGIRGEFHPIATNVAGVQISEHLPRLARHADKLTIIRSMTHGDSSHGSASHTMMTGRKPRVLGEVPPTPDDFPSFGSVIGRLRPSQGVLPPFVTLPWIISTSTNLVPGQDGGFLGQGMDPFRIAAPAATYGFQPPELTTDPSLSRERIATRRRLRDALEPVAFDPKTDQGVETIYHRAFDMLAAPNVSKAFDLTREPQTVRERYGMNAFGQSVLLARRLGEAGVSLITVYWPDRTEPESFINNGVRDKVAVAAWDTHGHHVGGTPNFPMLRDKNLPPLDIASAALLEDLAARGTLDETLVVWMGEFGRSPRINPDAGRDHYGNVFSIALAGGGVRGGCVHGASDRIGAFPAADPVSPAQLAATLYHCMGIRPDSLIRDPLGRPFPIAEADPIQAILQV